VRSHIKLGRIGGIEIGLHYSWFVIALLITFSLVTHFRSVNRAWNIGSIWAAALITAILFFATLLLHELAHSFVAISRGLSVRAITLFALGGVSQIESEAQDAKTEFWIAIVGPLTSFLIGVLCLGIAAALGWSPGREPSTPVPAVLIWLGYINISLAAFNMIPGYPLDGGRILRAVAWWITHSMERATRIAATNGQVVAFLFILYGIYRFFVGTSIGGLWIAFIGWFLLDAARSSYLQIDIAAGLRGHRVADFMERDCPSVPGYLSVRDFVDEYLLHGASRTFIVVQDRNPIGMVTATDVKKIPRDRWMQASLQSVMRPLDKMPTVPPDMLVMQALEVMGRENVNELAVVSNGKLEGIFSRNQVARFLQINPAFDQSHDQAA
jgi:Zn-dependent protease/CBS domain-containing protein